MLITNGTVLTFGGEKKVIPGGGVYFEGDTIVEVGPTSELKKKYPGAETLDADGKIIMPGLICAHTHFYGAFARGMYVPGEPPASFGEILESLWWKLDRALTLEDCKYSAYVCLVDAIRHGTTTLVDHHASPEAIDGSLDVIADAVLESGLRASLCYEVTDRNGDYGAKAGIAENVRFIRKMQVQSHPLLGASFGLHAPLTLSDATLEHCAAEAKALGVGFHSHVAEGKEDQADSLKRSGVRSVERYEKLGILGPGTIAVHCVHVDAFEMDILRATGTNVTHQPRSNMNNAVGVADVLGMLKRGINVGLGNDGFSNNNFTEMKLAYILHKLDRHDPRVMGGDTVMEMAFDNNAKIAGLFFQKPVGALEKGAFADIILLDYVPYTPLTDANYPWHVIFGVDGSHVTHTIVGGQVLMKDRHILTLDEKEIAAHADGLAQEVWRKVQEM